MDEPLCPKALLSGYTVDGTFQQYCIAKAAHVARIPKEVPLDAISPVLCAGITVYKGLKESGARPGQTVAIVGAGGGLGSLACQYAKAMGLKIIAIDAGNEKKEMTSKLGASSFVDFSTSENVVKDVQACTEDGLGPHAVILVAVNEKPFQQAAEVIPHIPALLYLLTVTVCSTSRHRRCHRSPSWSLSQSFRLRHCDQMYHNQGFLCRQPQGHSRGELNSKYSSFLWKTHAYLGYPILP